MQSMTWSTGTRLVMPARAMSAQLTRRAGPSLQVEAVCFSPEWGVLGMTDGAERLLALHGKAVER